MQVRGSRVTIAGALAPHKGHESFLHAAQRILKRRLDTDSVRSWGFMPAAVARDVLAASDLFLLPMMIEGFGLVITEAPACGVPVVTSAISPLKEIVIVGKSGFLVPPRDFELLADKVLDLLESSKKMKEFSIYGRELVRASFSAEAVVGRITHCYQEMLHRK
jgi:glycosyltransferase involved in cell wall biosynthesis